VDRSHNEREGREGKREGEPQLRTLLSISLCVCAKEVECSCVCNDSELFFLLPSLYPLDSYDSERNIILTKMSKSLGRGAAGGKWVSHRAQAAATQPPVVTPIHAAGSHGFEDSAIQERAHARAPQDEQPTSTAFDRQTVNDALSNLFLFRDEEAVETWTTFAAKKSIYPKSTLNFNKDILAIVKPIK
jgi:hypothetical protein